jgi:PPK2 family polyphosphate:nucleotide phosphotransferase
MKIDSPYRVSPHAKVKLAKWSTDSRGRYESEEEAKEDLQNNVQALSDWQEAFAADRKNALLIVLQGMDTGGKDGTIRHIFTGVNPQGCDVTGFKVPTAEEAAHDFLWRIHKAVPEKGKIGIFNRSQYEDVLVTRVHKMISDKEARRRMDQIVEFEKMLADNGVVILKFFLHISFQEQTTRLKARLADPDKRWKISLSDFKERNYWAKYQQCYEDAISATSRKHAPWFVVPADHKWYRNVVISGIVVEAMKAMNPKYPKAAIDLKKIHF